MLIAEKTIICNPKTSAKSSKEVKLATELFDKYGPAILGTIRSCINDKSQAEDIYHDFFLSLVRRPIPATTQNVKGYLCRAVKNDILDAALRSKNYKARIGRYAEIRKYAQPYPQPQNSAIRAEQTQIMFELIKSELPQREAQTVIERCYHDSDTQQTAEKMCVAKKSVSRYLSVGLRKIRQSIEENALAVDSSL